MSAKNKAVCKSSGSAEKSIDCVPCFPNKSKYFCGIVMLLSFAKLRSLFLAVEAPCSSPISYWYFPRPGPPPYWWTSILLSDSAFDTELENSLSALSSSLDHPLFFCIVLSICSDKIVGLDLS